MGEVLKQKTAEIEAAKADSYWQGYLAAVGASFHNASTSQYRQTAAYVDLAMHVIKDKQTLKSFQAAAKKHMPKETAKMIMDGVYKQPKCQAIFEKMLDDE